MMRRTAAISFLLAVLGAGGRGEPMTLQEDTAWRGEVVVGSDLVIPSGVTLTLAPQTVVKFLPRKEPSKILVMGRLIAQGEETGKISFTSSSSPPQPGDWWGIEFRSSDPTSLLQNCLIEYGRWGVFCLASSPKLKGDVISRNLRGGIACVNRSSPLVEDCQLWGNGEEGILCKYLSRPTVRGSQIRTNPYGIIILDYSCPFLGSEEEGGGNRIQGNSQWEIYNLSPLRIQAQGNFWGKDQPAEIDKRIYDDEEDNRLGEVVFTSPHPPLEGEEPDQGEPNPVAVGMLDSLPRIMGHPLLPADGRCLGEVVVEAWVDKEGRVTRTKVKRTELEVDCQNLALEFVKGWRFSPGTYQGKRVEFWTTVPIEFSKGER